MSLITHIDTYLNNHPKARDRVATLKGVCHQYDTCNKMGWLQSGYLTAILHYSIIRLSQNAKNINREIFDDKTAGIALIVAVGYIGILAQKALEKQNKVE